MDILIEESQTTLWAAALKNGKLEALEIDPVNEKIRWGSIYYARVKTLDPARDAAFLDLDGTHTGILYNQDTRRTSKDGTTVKGGAESISKRFQPGDMVLVQAKTAYLEGKDDSHIYENKIPQLSMDITLQGRHLIYCTTERKNRLSQRIRDKKLRKTIQSMLKHFDDLEGFIIRAAAANTQTDILRREAAILKEMWEDIASNATTSEPICLMHGPNAVERILSDQADQHIERIELTTMEHYNEAEHWTSLHAPGLVPKIVPMELDNASEDLALFHERDIVGQIEDLLQPYCILQHGGNLIIQSTAALTAIDVNAGGDKRGHLAINLEATREALRQLRLRNLGGVILIDLLKSNNTKMIKEILELAQNEAAKDHCTVQIHGQTGTGLLEITRKRRTPALDQRIDPNFL